MQNPNQRNDSYLGNINVKRDGVQHNFTQEEIEEYVKCSQDPVYFCKTYLKVISLKHIKITQKILKILYVSQETLMK